MAPLSGDLKSLGETILYSTNLALQDIDDDSVKIYPKDSGTNKDSMIKACEEFREEGIKIISPPKLTTYPSYDGENVIRVKVSKFYDPDGFLVELNQLLDPL